MCILIWKVQNYQSLVLAHRGLGNMGFLVYKWMYLLIYHIHNLLTRDMIPPSLEIICVMIRDCTYAHDYWIDHFWWPVDPSHHMLRDLYGLRKLSENLSKDKLIHTCATVSMGANTRVHKRHTRNVNTYLIISYTIYTISCLNVVQTHYMYLKCVPVTFLYTKLDK
jgi:hypothetical protein